ncbi:SH3 domain-containing protein [uncultured Aquimarina sp.]|uniref:SH3 domain-containing protein n=1 Tax=uncultured Aquimarina sp. TaxID=575652 RepID=UPI00261BB26D|nr:SH3 domain-containing protein [uncultured Aquimarina sp.]
MSNKKRFFLFFLFSIIGFANSQTDNSIFYVSAKSGLTIREKPNLDSQKIGVLTYKSAVKVLKVLDNNMIYIYDNKLKIKANWVRIENPNDPNIESYVFGGYLKQKEYFEKPIFDLSNWELYENEELGLSLKQPKDWMNFTVKNKGYKNWKENFILITHEDNEDPTQIIISKYKTPIKKILKDKGFTGGFEKIQEIYINKKLIIKRTLYFDHGCSLIQYFHEISNSMTGIVEISGVCISHQKDYDETKIKVAESVNFLNNL